MKIELGKRYVTRGSNEVVIYAIHERNPSYPVHGAIWEYDGWSVASWELDGKYSRTYVEQPKDIVAEMKG